MSSLLREEFFGLADQTRAALVFDLVLFYEGGFLGLDDAGTALNTLGRPIQEKDMVSIIIAKVRTW